MKPVTIKNTRMLAGVASMLECLGYETDDKSLALGMEAPYLFMRSENGFIAGTSLFRPHWINLYLHSIGFHLEQISLSKEDIPDFLRQHKTAMFPLQLSKDDDRLQPAVFTELLRGRFRIGTLLPEGSQHHSFTAAQLLSRLTDMNTVYVVSPVHPESVDFIPYLGESLKNLTLLQDDLKKILGQSVTRTEFDALKQSHLRALMHDLLPTASLTRDHMLMEELKIVNYFYASVFHKHGPERVLLRNRIPEVFVKNCINWLKEDIVDRLYDLGASDECVDSYRQATKP